MRKNSIVSTEGDSRIVTLPAGSSAQSAVFTKEALVIVSPTVDCFVRTGVNPTAVTTGADAFLFGGSPSLPLFVRAGEKLAFITSGGGAGVAYVSPVAE